MRCLSLVHGWDPCTWVRVGQGGQTSYSRTEGKKSECGDELHSDCISTQTSGYLPHYVRPQGSLQFRWLLPLARTVGGGVHGVGETSVCLGRAINKYPRETAIQRPANLVRCTSRRAASVFSPNHVLYVLRCGKASF